MEIYTVIINSKFSLHVEIIYNLKDSAEVKAYNCRVKQLLHV